MQRPSSVRLLSLSPHVQVLQEVTGKPTLYYREGGTIPAMALLKKELGIDMTMFGFGLPDDRIHAPNERWAEADNDSTCMWGEAGITLLPICEYVS